MKVVFLVSSREGEFCGVANYTDKLRCALKQQGMETVIETFPAWSFREALALRWRYNGHRNVLFHLQYPSFGMGRSVAPGMLPFLLGFKRTLVTLHEFSNFNALRKAIFLPYKAAAQIVLTNVHERNKLSEQFNDTQNISVIPIGSNISAPLWLTGYAARAPRLVYFGQIAPGKGLEDFLDTVVLLKNRGIQLLATIAGSIPDRETATAKRVLSEAGPNNIQLLTDLSEAEVSRLLESCTIALLMFRDGLSEKRGTAIACLEHKVHVITKHSEKTPLWMKEITHGASSPSEAADAIERLLNGPPAADLMTKTELQQMKWPEIARRHVELYERIACSGPV